MSSKRTSLQNRVTMLFAKLRRVLGLGADERGSAESDAATPDEPPEGDPPAPVDDRILADGSGAEETLSRSELAGATGRSPEAYVQQLLAEHDGRLRQGDVRELTRLSASTTSRLLSEMESDQQIRRVSIGREKVVCLPSEAPDTAPDTAVDSAPDGAA